MFGWILSDETVFLNVDAIFIQTWTDQTRAKLPHSLVDLGWFKGKLRLLRLASPALVKTAFDQAEAR